MFDPQKIRTQRSLQEPLHTADPSLFPHDEEVPEGCVELDGLKDEYGYLVDIHTDVVYCVRTHEKTKEKKPLHLIILEPKDNHKQEKQWSCLVYVQGSAFHQQWLWNSISRLIRLAEKGFAIAIVEYRPSEFAPFPAQVQDTKTAIRFIRQEAARYHIDPNHIALGGDSSGAHTALIAGFSGDRPPVSEDHGHVSAAVNCIVDLYGPTVFSLMNYYASAQNHYDPQSPEGFEIGQKNVLEHPELVEATIPMHYLSADQDTPPLLIMHGSRDMLVPFSQSVFLYQSMKSLGKEVTFYKINDANHGFLGFNNDTVLNIVAEFLKAHI